VRTLELEDTVGATTQTPTLSIDGTRLLLDGEHYCMQGLSFFNALYNPTFNEDRGKWLDTFLANGVNMLRIWCQWDFDPVRRPFVDSAPDATLYADDGSLKADVLERLHKLLQVTAERKIVVEVTLFAKEKAPNQPIEYLLTGTKAAAEALKPHRHVILQLWNEHTRADRELFDAAKGADPDRLVTSSVGGSSVLGTDEQNSMYDLLTPHTARREAERYWEEAPRQLAGLMEKFRKPVLDDEPARCGLKEHGGIPGGTRAEDHITQIEAVRAIGSYHVYHHDMFQRPRRTPATPSSGIPEPDFSPYHRKVFDYLRDHTTW
jgi:hypothetical protein